LPNFRNRFFPLAFFLNANDFTFTTSSIEKISLIFVRTFRVTFSFRGWELPRELRILFPFPSEACRSSTLQEGKEFCPEI